MSQDPANKPGFVIFKHENILHSRDRATTTRRTRTDNHQ